MLIQALWLNTWAWGSLFTSELVYVQFIGMTPYEMGGGLYRRL
jgi:hypothetical protein